MPEVSPQTTDLADLLRDVIRLKGFTLDDAHTRDMDDALSVEVLEGGGWKVSVSIANVALSIEPGSELDLQARAAVATRYFGTGNSPMLPRDLADDTLSLWPDRPKVVMVIEIMLDPQVNVVNVRFYPGRLRSLGKLAYNEVPDILKNPSLKFHTEISALSNLAKVLLDKRRKAGALVLYDINNGWVTTEEGFIRQLKDREDTVGHIIVQEFMILANSLVAQAMVKADVPFLYRNHTARLASPSRTDLMQTIETAMRGGIIADLEALRERTHMLMDKADYGASLKGHYGLNLPAYTHFTSPIRRYADLVNHQQFRAWLRKETLPYTKEQVEDIASHINEVNKNELASRSASMKAKAEERVKSKVTARQIDALGVKDFERLVKIQARLVDEGLPVDADDALVENFAKRIADERMPAICVTVAMAEGPAKPNWRKIHENLLDHLVRKPELAATVFAMAIQTYGPEWTPTFTTTSQGPDHLKTFTVEGRLKRGETVFDVVQTDAPKKLAEQRAAVRLLAAMTYLPPPVFPSKVSVPVLTPSAPNKKPVGYDGTKDPISFVNEYAQSLGKPLPTFQVESTGPSHVPIMMCTCTFMDKVVKGEAGNKQEAKRQAAKALITLLGL